MSRDCESIQNMVLEPVWVIISDHNIWVEIPQEDGYNASSVNYWFMIGRNFSQNKKYETFEVGGEGGGDEQPKNCPALNNTFQNNYIFDNT